MALWTPQDEPGLIAWWDMSNPASYNTGTKTWASKYGSKNLVAPGDGPSVITNGLGGTYNALQFSGAADTGLSLANPGFNEVAMVYVLHLSTSVDITVTEHEFGDERTIMFAGGGGRVEYLDQSTDYYTGGSWPRTVLVVVRQGDAQRIQRWNGEEVANEVVNASGTPILTTATFRLLPNQGAAFTAQVAAFGLFNYLDFDTPLAEQIEGYVAHQSLGTTTAALPVGHTYKTAAPETVGDVVLEVSANQQMADFTQTVTASTIIEMGAYQVMADPVPLTWGEEILTWEGEALTWGTTDFIQIATLGDGLNISVVQQLEDFTQEVVMVPESMLEALSLVAAQEMEDFIQSVRIGRLVDAAPHPGFPTRSVGPGVPGIPVKTERPVTMEYYRQWPTK